MGNRMNYLVGTLTFFALLSLAGCTSDSDLLYLNDKVNKVEQRIGALEQHLSKQGSEDVLALRRTVADNTAETERLKRELDSLRASIEDLKSRRVNRIEVSQQGLISRVSDLEADMARVRAQLKLEPAASGSEAKSYVSETSEPKMATPAPGGATGVIEGAPKSQVQSQKVSPAPQSVASAPTTAPSTRPEVEKSTPVKEPDALQKGVDLVKKGNTKEAIPIFDGIIKGKAKNEDKAEAYYWLAECYMNQKDYEKAILTYQDLIKGYPESQRIPSALMKQAEAFSEIKDNMSAIILYRQVIKKYPGSQEAKIAEKRVQELEKKKR